jgi:hypothetical protein
MFITIKRSELVAKNACERGMAYFKTLAPKGVLRLEWTCANQIKLATEAREWLDWARDHIGFPGFNLRSADLTSADLTSANLTSADLYGAFRDTDLPGWKSVNGRLERAS